RHGELEWAHLQRSLADGEVDRLALRVRRAGEPREVLAGHGEVAGGGAGQVDLRPRAEAELARPGLDQRRLPRGIGAPDPGAEPVEPRVARLLERGRQGHRLVGAALDVVERVVAESERARAGLGGARRDDPGGERGFGDDGPERRAGRVDAADRPVHRRGRIRLLVQMCEVGRAVGRELLVEGRIAHERLDRARPGVDCHSRCAGWVVAEGTRLRDSVCESVLRGLLETHVDRELQGRRLLLAWHSEWAGDAAERVHGDLRLHEALVEKGVVLRLDAARTDDLARLRALVRAGLQLLRVELAEQADELAAEGALRVVPGVLDPHLEAGVLPTSLL